jgi:two-component system, sensor histidine kinase
MRVGSIQFRMLLLALLPVSLVVVLLSGAFLVARVDDIGSAHGQRVRSLARQLATASEYGVFSNNTQHLQSVALGALLEPDVRSVMILGGQGQVLVQLGTPSDQLPLDQLSAQEGERFDPATRRELLWQPILPSRVFLGDLFEPEPMSSSPPPLGHVLLELSREALDQRTRDMQLLALVIGLGGLLLGGVLALQLGRRVIRPILRVSQTIERIGRGDLSARATLLPDDPLRDLQQGLNKMAQGLESGRDELERRVTLATLELRQKMEEAENATLAKSRFLAAASHDLRQPTHALGMFVARLSQISHDDETTTLIGHLDSAVRATQNLLDGLLDISRLDAGAVQVRVRPFALADLFAQLHEALAPTADHKGLQLRVRHSRVWLVSDPTLLYRVVLNLVSNALNYTLQGGVLVAGRLAGDGKHVRIEVWDTGIGIAPEHHQEIFREFYQVGNPERNRDKGLGLGLNIVQRTVDLLGHRLRMRSRVGFGTCFSIEVPTFHEAHLGVPKEVNHLRAVDDLTGLVVLVIEDDLLALEGLVTLLESWGVVVGVADGLSAARWQLENGLRPDVIVSDYRLCDGKSGLEVIQQLRAATGRHVAACLMSGDTDPHVLQAARETGLTLLHKPVRPAKLRNLIRRLARDAQADGGSMA